jgi:hypothetical protein
MKDSFFLLRRIACRALEGRSASAYRVAWEGKIWTNAKISMKLRKLIRLQMGNR